MGSRTPLKHGNMRVVKYGIKNAPETWEYKSCEIWDQERSWKWEYESCEIWDKERPWNMGILELWSMGWKTPLKHGNIRVVKYGITNAPETWEYESSEIWDQERPWNMGIWESWNMGSKTVVVSMWGGGATFALWPLTFGRWPWWPPFEVVTLHPVNFNEFCQAFVITFG